MSPIPFQLLELTIISAQDLAPISKNLRTYAITWINPDKKMRTKIDSEGQNNPNWNEKFMFRVNEKVLESDTEAVKIEIFAVGWLRDFPIGSVEVLIGDLVPPAVRYQSRSRRRLIKLQIRRPSGRPQGILNVGVTLLENSMKSMPLSSELSASAVDFQEGNKKEENQKREPEKKPLLRRSQSDRTDFIEYRSKPNKITGGAASDHDVNSIIDVGSVVKFGSVYGSQVNGSDVGFHKGGSICNSDVGPSASVVAAAIAQGLYPMTLSQPNKPGSSILGDWMVEDTSAEGLKSKIERWKTELPPLYDNAKNNYRKIPRKSGKKYSKRREKNGFGNRISCFGGSCQIMISCGGK